MQKAIPVGISNFKALITENYLYIDKTKYIELLEKTNYKTLVFLRPRRFGKSLFITMMYNYYEINKKNEFEDVFKNLYIGKNPTKLKSSYIVWNIDFSGLNTDSKKELRYSFTDTIIMSIMSIFGRYQDIFDYKNSSEMLLTKEDSKSAVLFLLNELEKANKKVILLVDEYDHFANDLIAIDDGITYKEVVNANGFVRDFYEAVKDGTKSHIDRIFMTGVSPVMLDDLTSGFNISTNLSLWGIFNSMLGFNDSELNYILDNCDFIKDFPRETLLNEFRKNYNGYQFSEESNEKVYNSNMVLNFLGEWQAKNSYPKKFLDPNINIDRNRLTMLAKNQNNKDKIMEILENGYIVESIEEKFPFEFMYEDENFISLLFYLGLLTIKETDEVNPTLAIPNYVAKVVYWEYLRYYLEKNSEIRINKSKFSKVIRNLIDGDILPFVNYINENIVKIISNRDLIKFDEKHIKLILLAYIVRENIYRVVSERECQNGYIDLLLERHIYYKDRVKYDWMIELKYIKKSDKSNFDSVLFEAETQLINYSKDPEYIGRSDIKYAVIIFIGKDDVFAKELTNIQ